MRQDADSFPDEELVVVYLARRLKESLKVEELLTQHQIDYLVETGTYLGGFLFRRELTGAYFYVPPGEAPRTRELLTANGYKPEGGE